MPVGEPLIILIAVLLVAMPVTHDLPTSPEQRLHSAARHGLVAVPVALGVANSCSVIENHLTVHTWAERVSILSTNSVHVTTRDHDWLRVLMENAGSRWSKVRVVCRGVMGDHWSILADFIVVEH